MLPPPPPPPPPPPLIPPGFVPQVLSLPSPGRAWQDPDLGRATPSPPAAPRAGALLEEVDEAPETPAELLRRPATLVPAGQASQRFIASGGWSGLGRAIYAAPAPSAPAATPLPQRAYPNTRSRGCNGGWEVQPSRHPRRTALPLARGAFTAAQRPPAPAWLMGRCFNCLYKGRLAHRASECRDPIKCRNCFRSGHCERACHHPPEPLPSPTTASSSPVRRPAAVKAPPPRPPLQQPAWAGPAQAPAADATMPRLGDIPRPAEVFVVIHATPEMNAEAAALLTKAAYVWCERPPTHNAKATMERAIKATIGALHDDFRITEHFPEPYLVRFVYPHHRDDAVSLHDFAFEGLKIQVRPWRFEDNAEQVNLRQHVRLCIENIPLYAWNASSAQQAIGSGCSLDYIDEPCVRREYTKALCVWAWVEHPGLVPRVGWVTLPGPDVAPGMQERGRRGLQRRCIVHLDIVEDLTNEDAPMPSKGS
ncbi:hypothetical protein ACQ4PT_060691 [Festuca glaucescens]